MTEPVSVHVSREAAYVDPSLTNVYGEEVKEIIGIAAACLVAKGNKNSDKPEELSNGETLLSAPDGSWMLVKPSDDTTRQIMLRIDEWEILDKDEADRRANEIKSNRVNEASHRDEENKARLNAISDDVINEKLRAMRAAYAAETMAVSPKNSVELGKIAHATSDGDKPLALIAFDPSYRPDGLHLETLPPAYAPPS